VRSQDKPIRRLKPPLRDRFNVSTVQRFNVAKQEPRRGLPDGVLFDRLLGHHFHQAATAWAAGTAAAAVFIIRRHRRSRGERQKRCQNEYVFHNSSVELRSNLGACTHRAVAGGIKRAAAGSAAAQSEGCRRFR